MTNSVFPLEIGKKYIRFRSRDIRCWLAAIGGNDIVLFGVVLEESGDDRARDLCDCDGDGGCCCRVWFTAEAAVPQRLRQAH